MRNPSSLLGRFPFYLALLIFSLAGIVSVTGKGTHGNRSTHHHDGITETYFWDFENRLIGLEKPGTGSYSYIYDHRTRRVVRDESGAGGDEAILSFSGGTSVQEWSNSLLVSEQIRGSDWGGGVGGVLYTIRNNQRSYNSYNSRGDVVSASDQTGTATWQASYEAFGRRTQEKGTNAERQRANTKDEDPTGLLNEGFRYRDLETGVFISRDPAGFVDGPNVYTYVRQNPWSFFDPHGLDMKRAGQKLDNAISSIVGMVTRNPSEGLDAGASLIEAGMEIIDSGIDKISGSAKGGEKAVEYAAGMNPVVAAIDTAQQIVEEGVTVENVMGVVIDQVVRRIPGGKGHGDEVMGAVNKGLDKVEGMVDSARKRVTNSRAARREVMRQDGIPTSQQPTSQSRNASGREQSYEVPKPGGGTQKKSVQQQTMDSSHPGQGHWEAGKVKTDPLTGETRMSQHDRPKLTNDKSKVDYNE